MDFLTGIQTAAEWLASIFSRLWTLILAYPFVTAAVLMPFFVWILFRLVSLIQNASRFDVEEWSGSGLVGVVKRHKERQEEKRREGFAQRIFRQDENLDVQWVDIDGQRFYRNHRSRRYKVRLGDRAAEYYNPDGNEVPVYDGKRQTRKRG